MYGMKFRVNIKAATKIHYLAAGFNTPTWGSSVSTVSVGVGDAKTRVGQKRRCSSEEDHESSEEVGGRHHLQQLLHQRGQISFFKQQSKAQRRHLNFQRRYFSASQSQEFWNSSEKKLRLCCLQLQKEEKNKSLYQTILQPRKLQLFAKRMKPIQVQEEVREKLLSNITF